jgi:two-component system, LytTR family, response regulator
MKVVLVDDEPQNNLAMQGILTDLFPHIQIAEICANTTEARNAIIKHRPDVLFLDISMPNESGLEFIAKLGAIDFLVVFVSAYNEYGMQVIKLSAVDYILKPLVKEDIIAAVEKLEVRLKEKKDSSRYQLMQEIMQEGFTGRMMLPGKSGIHEVVKTSDIMFCKANGYATEFYISDGRKLVTANNLGTYKDALAPFGIVQSHQSFLVNIKYVSSFDTGTSELLMQLAKNEKEPKRVSVARGNRAEILELLKS